MPISTKYCFVRLLPLLHRLVPNSIADVKLNICEYSGIIHAYPYTHIYAHIRTHIRMTDIDNKFGLYDYKYEFYDICKGIEHVRKFDKTIQAILEKDSESFYTILRYGARKARFYGNIIVIEKFKRLYLHHVFDILDVVSRKNACNNVQKIVKAEINDYDAHGKK